MTTVNTPTHTGRRDTVNELALYRLNHDFADAMNQMRPELVAPMFTDDGEMTITNWGECRTPQGIVDFLADLLKDWTVMFFAIHSGRVDVGDDGDTATGQWYISEYGIKLGQDYSISGVYHDTYRRVDGDWRFVTRRYDTMHIRLDGEVTVVSFPEDLKRAVR